MAHYKRSRKDFEADLQAQQSPFVAYGTALPPLDPDVRDDGSYVPVWKQDAVDDQGRKRFHGAFTGGYSAGYYNTVGSKDGWTPATFVSSRSNRHKNATQQRPEDFMDDEDRADATDAQTLQTNQAFSALGSTATDNMYQGSLMELLHPHGDTFGVKLLRRMGWHEGQAIGSKSRRSATAGDVTTVGQQVLAPQNTAIVQFARKNDRKGLGRVGEARLHAFDKLSRQSQESTSEPGASKKTKKEPSREPNKPSRGSGVGILNDDGDEDDDPYSMGPQISYNRSIGSDKKSKSTSRTNKPGVAVTPSANPLLNARPVFRSKKALDSAGLRRCSDGRSPLIGFVLSEKLALLDLSSNEQKYPLPRVPSGWQPAKTTGSGLDASYASTAEAAQISSLDAKSRSVILGETRLPGKSVFDFMSSSGRNRIVGATGRGDLPAALDEKRSEAHKTPQLQEIPVVDKSVALAALGRGVGGWMPYADDEPKRQRYRAFLEYQGGLGGEAPRKPSGLNRDNWHQELAEFAHAAAVFKPISGMMASRFASASTAPTPGSTDAQGDEPPREAQTSQPEKPPDPAELAASRALYGPLTRSSHQFYPARLLCKRFNVQLPSNVEGRPGNEATQPSTFAASSDAANPTQDLVSQKDLDLLIQEASKMSRAGDTSRTTEEKVDASKNEALEQPRANEAIYKAIFGDDDDDDNDG